jgi:hypothetical protein
LSGSKVQFLTAVNLPPGTIIYLRPMTPDECIAEVHAIMKQGTGPFTRKMIATVLEETHNLYHQEAMLNVSIAIQADKGKLFKRVKPGWWDLA